MTDTVWLLLIFGIMAFGVYKQYMIYRVIEETTDHD